MIKKICLTLMLGVLILVSGCSRKRDISAIEISDTTSLETVSEFEDALYFSNNFSDNVVRRTSSFSSVSISQKMSTYSIINDKRELGKTIYNAFLTVDTKNQIVQTAVPSDTGMSYSFFDDYKDNIYLTQINNGEYIQNTTPLSESGIDFSVATNAFSLIKFICKDGFPDESTVGIPDKSNKAYIFTVTRPAQESDLVNVEYDKLGETTVRLMLQQDSTNSFKPLSLTSDTSFYVKSLEYGISTSCTFSSYSNDYLLLPPYLEISR